MLEKKYNHHSWIIQYSVFHKKFQSINGLKDNYSFIGSTKIHEYTAGSCTTHVRVNNRSSYQEAFVLDTRTLFLQNFMKCLIIAASKIMVTSG